MRKHLDAKKQQKNKVEIQNEFQPYNIFATVKIRPT